MPNNTALVLRATGAQGRGVTRHLLKAGWTVHAFAADIENPRAIALKELGATLFKGTLSDTSSIEHAIQGCDVLFLNQMPPPEVGGEAREAASVLSLAKAAGVKHVVHSTVLVLNDGDIRSKLESSPLGFGVLGKADVEDLVRDSGLTWTIIRPGYFMTNLIQPLVHFMFPDLVKGVFENCFRPETILPLVDPDDIGALVALAFKEPGKFQGKILNLASEMMTVSDIVGEIGRAAGKEVKHVYRAFEDRSEEEKSNPLIVGQTMSIGMEKWVDMEEVKTWGVPLTTFREFLQTHKEAVVP